MRPLKAGAAYYLDCRVGRATLACMRSLLAMTGVLCGRYMAQSRQSRREITSLKKGNTN